LSANFTINAVDDDDIDGTQTVTILATASGLVDGSDSLNVLDDEVAPVSHRFDFGSGGSPLESGYTRVTGTTTYSGSRGYGWSGGTVSSVDRGNGTDMKRDANFRDVGTFVVDVPIGKYDVTLTVGDKGPYPHDQQVFLEGASVDTISTGAGQTLTRTYNNVAVSDGQLTLRLDGRGGVDPNMIINALEVTETASTPALGAMPMRSHGELLAASGYQQRPGEGRKRCQVQ
jgi:fibronectin type 3 domain-containing protein